jgi:hypothetical protein
LIKLNSAIKKLSHAKAQRRKVFALLCGLATWREINIAKKIISGGLAKVVFNVR